MRIGNGYPFGGRMALLSVKRHSFYFAALHRISIRINESMPQLIIIFHFRHIHVLHSCLDADPGI